MDRPVILCLASYFKGVRFLEAAHAAGAHVVLLTREALQDEPWPMHAVDERFLMPSLQTQPDLQHAVSYLARTRPFARIVALDEYDTLPAAQLREHLRVPGMGATTSRFFRDKLAMRVRAQSRGLPVPPFVHALNDAAVRAWAERVPPPWVLKPRTEASAMGIQRIYDADALGPALDALGDRRSFFLLEQFLPGQVFHVDGLVAGRRTQFAVASGYERPPLQIYQDGGVFATRTVDDPDDRASLRVLHDRLMEAFGYVEGVTHAEFIRHDADGRLYFLEVAARVGGAGIDQLVEAASGVNPWAEWAHLEVGLARSRPYALPRLSDRHAALLVCLARTRHPDLSGYDADEVVHRMTKHYHAGLVLAAADADRVAALVDSYAARFAHDFLATQPPLDAAPE